MKCLEKKTLNKLDIIAGPNIQVAKFLIYPDFADTEHQYKYYGILL